MVTCNKCKSTNVQKNGRSRSGTQQYRCMSCGKFGQVGSAFTGDSQVEPIKNNMENKIGISISEFRQKHDLNFIVSKVLKTLDRQHLYEKSDVAKLCKLQPTYPGLRAVLEETKEFEKYRGRVAGRFYYGHPDIIEQLKNEGQLMSSHS